MGPGRARTHILFYSNASQPFGLDEQILDINDINSQNANNLQPKVDQV